MRHHRRSARSAQHARATSVFSFLIVCASSRQTRRQRTLSRPDAARAAGSARGRFAAGSAAEGRAPPPPPSSPHAAASAATTPKVVTTTSARRSREGSRSRSAPWYLGVR